VPSRGYRIRWPPTGFDLVKRDSGAHTFYRHPAHPELALAVPRARRLRPYLVADAVRIFGGPLFRVTDAVRLIGRLLAAEAQESQ